MTPEGNFTLTYFPNDPNAKPCTALEEAIQFLYDNRGYNEEDLPHASDVNKQLLNVINNVLLPACEEGNQEAVYWMFFAYDRGIGVEWDEDKALEYLKRLADHGYPNMQYAMGECYRSEDVVFNAHVRKMNSEAVKWYTKAAKQGNEEAMYRLGKCFRDKSSGKRSCRKSFLWYKRAAERGHKEAMEELGFCFQRGIGTKKDLATAAEWYEKAGMHDKAERLRNGEDESAFDVFPSHPIPCLEEVDGLIPFPEMDMENPF